MNVNNGRINIDDLQDTKGRIQQ